jgi:hypothetical protein
MAINMIKILLLTFLIYMVSCRGPELEGHWHLTRIGQGESSLIESYPTIDFEDDTTVCLGKYIGSYGRIYGYHDKLKKRMRFGGECLVVDFRYETRGRDLILYHERYDEEHDEKFLAQKYNWSDCDKQAEFFYGQNVTIDLPVIFEGQEFTKLTHGEPGMGIYLGIPFDKLQNTYGKEHKMVLGGKFSEVKDLDLWEEIIKLKWFNPEGLRPKRILYADKNTPFEKIEAVIDFYYDQGVEEVFLALRNEETEDS